MTTFDRRCLLSLVVATCLLSSAAVPALAPPPQGSTGGGTIYFGSGSATMTMNSDGSSKTALPAGVSGEPSRGTPGGHRWFVQSRILAGQFYPNGKPRRELFAVRDDANTAVEVQLTGQPDLECGSPVQLQARWTPGDAGMSFLARRWNLGTGQIVEGGIYAADLVYDAAGNVSGLVGQPTAPLVPEALVTWPNVGGGIWSNEPGPDIYSFSWSPANTQLVYERMNRTALRVATIGGSTTTILSGTWCAGPEWSPTGVRIAYTNQQHGVSTILPNGTGIVLVIRQTAVPTYGKPSWSPTGSHLTFYKFTGSYPSYHVMRCTATGGSLTNLTSGLAVGGMPIGWR